MPFTALTIAADGRPDPAPPPSNKTSGSISIPKIDVFLLYCREVFDPACRCDKACCFATPRHDFC
jgi:hypothetical protein